MAVCKPYFVPVIVVIPTLLLIVRVGVRLPSQLKGFLLYIQVSQSCKQVSS